MKIRDSQSKDALAVGVGAILGALLLLKFPFLAIAIGVFGVVLLGRGLWWMYRYRKILRAKRELLQAFRRFLSSVGTRYLESDSNHIQLTKSKRAYLVIVRHPGDIFQTPQGTVLLCETFTILKRHFFVAKSRDVVRLVNGKLVPDDRGPISTKQAKELEATGSLTADEMEIRTLISLLRTATVIG